jgi:hypothetical protein
MAEDAAEVVTAYFDTWKGDDFGTMRSLVDDRRLHSPRRASPSYPRLGKGAFVHP